MDDKMFELMTKMYSEMQGLKGDISAISSEMQGLKGDVSAINSEMQGLKGDASAINSEMQGLKGDVNKIYIKIENDVEPKLEALFDGYKQTFELEKENSKKLDDIAVKVIKQEVEIKVMQGGKK